MNIVNSTSLSNLGDCVAVIQVELDGGRGDVLRFDELEQKFLRRLVAVGPLLFIP